MKKLTTAAVRHLIREAREEAERWKFGLDRDYANSWGGAFKNLAPQEGGR